MEAPPDGRILGLQYGEFGGAPDELLRQAHLEHAACACGLGVGKFAAINPQPQASGVPALVPDALKQMLVSTIDDEHLASVAYEAGAAFPVG